MVLGLFCLGTLVLRLFYITKVNGPFVYADELGYWSHAAHMAGHTWAGVMDGVSWYAFGYSFVLLPAILLSGQMAVAYKIAVLLNVAMCLCVYGLAYALARRLFPSFGVFQGGMIAFTATSFTSYIFYSYITMCETLVCLLVWLIFYEVVSLEERDAWWKGILLGLTAGFAYMVHNRMIAAAIAVFLCVFILLLLRRLDWRTAVLCLIGFAGMFFLNGLIKAYLTGMVEHNSVMEALGLSIEMGGANSGGAQMQKLLSLFTPNGFLQFFLNGLGQIWECLSATYLLFGFGMVYAVWRGYRNYKDGERVLPYLFPAAAVFLSIAVTAVFFFATPLSEAAGKTRIDTLFYARYNECYLGLLLLLGLGMLFEETCPDGKRFWWKTVLGTAGAYLALSLLMAMRIGDPGDKYLNVVSATGIHVFHWLGEFSVGKCAVIVLMAAVLFVAILQDRNPKGIQRCLVCLGLVFFFSTTALHCMRTCIRGENDYTARYMEIFDYLNENTKSGDVVYVCEEEKMAFDVQTRLMDKTVVSIAPRQLDKAKPGEYAVIRTEDVSEMAEISYESCLEDEEYLVILVKQ